MKIPHFQYRHIAPDSDVPAFVSVRGYVYSLRRARIMQGLSVSAEYKLRCR